MRVGQWGEGAWPPVSPHHSNQQEGQAAWPALPTAQRVSFPLCTKGARGAHLCPEQSTLRGGHHYHPSGETEATGATSSLWSYPGVEVVLIQWGHAFQGPPPKTPPHIPNNGSEEGRAGQQGNRAGGGQEGGHPQEAALFPELRFKETQDAKLSPNHCGRYHCHSLAHSWEGWGSNVWAKGPAPHPGLQGPGPSLVAPSDPAPPPLHCNFWKFLALPPCSCLCAQTALSGHFLLSV